MCGKSREEFDELLERQNKAEDHQLMMNYHLARLRAIELLSEVVSLNKVVVNVVVSLLAKCEEIGE